MSGLTYYDGEPASIEPGFKTMLAHAMADQYAALAGMPPTATSYGAYLPGLAVAATSFVYRFASGSEEDPIDLTEDGSEADPIVLD